MSLSLEYLPAAEIDLAKACDWYEEQRPGLGSRFRRAVVAAAIDVSQWPCSYPLIRTRTRRALIRGFPYVMLFEVRGDAVVIAGVFHGKRHPDSWSDRVRESALPYGVTETMNLTIGALS